MSQPGNGFLAIIFAGELVVVNTVTRPVPPAPFITGSACLLFAYGNIAIKPPITAASAKRPVRLHPGGYSRYGTGSPGRQ